MLILLYRFSVKNIASRPVFRVKLAIFLPSQIAIFEISIYFETEKSAKLLSYIVIVLVKKIKPVKFSSEVVGTNWVPKSSFLDFCKKNETLQNKKETVLRITFTSESTGFKTRLPITFQLK